MIIKSFPQKRQAAIAIPRPTRVAPRTSFIKKLLNCTGRGKNHRKTADSPDKGAEVEKPLSQDAQSNPDNHIFLMSEIYQAGQISHPTRCGGASQGASVIDEK